MQGSPTLVTLAVVESEQVVQALAPALFPLFVAEVVCIRVDPQKPAAECHNFRKHVAGVTRPQQEVIV